METFHCPNCGRELKNGRQATVIGRIRRDREASFLGLGQPVKTITCPGCGFAIECERILHGEHEIGFTPTGGWIALIVGLPTALALWAFDDAEWWQGAVLGLLVGALIGRFWSYLESHRRAH
jgi:hypothetical protein